MRKSTSSAPPRADTSYHSSPATMLARAGSTLWTLAREATALKRAAGRFSTGPDVPEVAILGLQAGLWAWHREVVRAKS